MSFAKKIFFFHLWNILKKDESYEISERSVQDYENFCVVILFFISVFGTDIESGIVDKLLIVYTLSEI